MKKTVAVNIYNFIRMSHMEPSRFLLDDYETVENQILLVKQFGFPATYALKYDALMEPRYQRLLQEQLDAEDEISAWWEITRELCEKANVPFRGGKATEEYDERVDSAYSIGYAPEERKRLVDAYMADFYGIFGKYPKTIGSWVLDTVTLSYASERYGVLGGAICRDQLGTDGFTLWGGFPNGIYYPSWKNENIPAQSVKGQLSVPVFRLLGPDPIYNFEQDVRPGLQGVYTLEPSWVTGRDPKWISWIFGCLTEEDALGVGYAQVGQENNFLWENIKPGLAPQLAKVRDLAEAGKLRVETMAQTAAWFRQSYRLTPPMTFQASKDWNEKENLSAQWYAGAHYRVGFLGEQGRLRIRDFFQYAEAYPSRYLDAAMTEKKSTFDALPLLYPQLWMQRGEKRPFIRLLDEQGEEPEGEFRHFAEDALTAKAELWQGEKRLACFTMRPASITLEGFYRLHFDCLPVLKNCTNSRVLLEHRGFTYGFAVENGKIAQVGDGLEIVPEEEKISLIFGPNLTKTDIFSADCPVIEKMPKSFASSAKNVPPMEPVFQPESSVFDLGAPAEIQLSAQTPGVIRYTLDGSEPNAQSPAYEAPLRLEKDTVVFARLFLPDGRCSKAVSASYKFGLKTIELTSEMALDARPVFGGNGICDLLATKRGSLDYLDGRWRGTLQNLDMTGKLPEAVFVKEISIGFLSHHRCGVIYPERVQLFTGENEGHLTLKQTIVLPCAPCEREIAKQDVTFAVHETIGAFRLIAYRYDKMPQWCCYKGAENVFTMADNLIVSI